MKGIKQIHFIPRCKWDAVWQKILSISNRGCQECHIPDSQNAHGHKQFPMIRVPIAIGDKIRLGILNAFTERSVSGEAPSAGVRLHIGPAVDVLATSFQHKVCTFQSSLGLIYLSIGAFYKMEI